MRERAARPESLLLICLLVASALTLVPSQAAHAQTTNGSQAASSGLTLGKVKLVQKSESTCSYVCSSGQTAASFSHSVRRGDMLVVTVVSDDLTTLVVSDSFGTAIRLAVSSTSTSCATNTGTCQADIYWGMLTSSGPDTVTVSEGTSDHALRVQTWEFSGVNAVKSAVSCAPACTSTSYPSFSVLIATGLYVSGAGPGFSWYPYAASGVAGSEFRITTRPGSTSFPFSAPVNDAEAGAVLVRSS